MIMNKFKLSIREVLLISILAVAIVIYVYLSYFIFPGYTRIAQLDTELMLIKRVAADRDEALRLLENLDSHLVESKAQLEKLEKKIPYHVRLPELVVSIDSKISSLDMDIQSIYIGEPDTANKEYDIVPINVSMEGKYDNIIGFIKYIEDNERKFIIDSFTLAPIIRAGAIPFDIEMRTFVLKESQETSIPEPQDYYFFKHNNGKSYPFLENGKAPGKLNNTIENDILEMEKKLESLGNIKIDGLKNLIPQIKEVRKGN
jgi:Tfp pilus assembly protein PilO